MKSASENLLDLLKRESPAWLASGEIQRMEIHNADGTLATPRSLVRRLEELVEDGKIEVEYRGKNHAFYRAKNEAWKSIKRAIYDPVTNTARMVEIKV